MNVIVGNAQQSMLSNLDIDVIKSISGVFTSKELVGMFRNFFFNKMVLDVTAIKDCGNINSYRELASGLDSDKIIYFIPENSPLCTAAFFSDLVTIGIYNFTTNVDGIKYLLRHSNTYNEVAQFQQNGRGNNNYQNYQQPQDFSNGSADYYDASNDYYNTPNNMPPNMASYEPNNQMSYDQGNNNMGPPVGLAISQSPLLAGMNNNTQYQQQNRNDSVRTQVVIGVKSVTLSAGASTLIYMMKKELNAKVGPNVLAVEVDKRDFKLFNEKNMDSISKAELRNYIDSAQIIIVDLNDYEDGENLCDEVIYLLESSIIKLNRLLQMNSKVLGRLRGKRVVLNRSLLSNKDIADFEYESGLKVFYNIPPLDERKHNEVIVDFLSKLGLLNLNSRNSNRVFGLFRR